MKIINLMEKHCICRVIKVTAKYEDGDKDIYQAEITDDKKLFSLAFSEGGVTGNITYIADCEPPLDKINLMKELAGCLIENSDYWHFNNALSHVTEMSADNISLEDVITQTLQTLVSSHFFDRAAVMFYNEKQSELRGIGIVGVPPYTEENTAKFRNVRIPVDKAILTSQDGIIAASHIQKEIFTVFANNQPLSNNILITPIMTNNKIYGALVLYADKPYDERHTFAAQSTARFITATIAAVIVYNKYKYSLASEKQLNQQIKNNEALITLGNYAATLAHEIKNPLISIGGFAKRIMKAVADPDLQKMAKIISTESERLERLTEDILSYAKKHEPIKTPVNLKEEIEHIKMLFENRSKDTNISINIGIDPKTIIYVDKNQFRQVVVNLVANAMNAIEKNGHINITCLEHDSFNNLIISDTGSGIPEDNMPQLFKPFFTTSKNGTGLGLAISKKIMINHGGDIVAKNGKVGAEFTLIIPKK